VIEYLNLNFINVKINKDQNQPLAGTYRVTSIPASLFLDETGGKLGEISGYLPAEPFLDALKKAVENRKKLADLDARTVKDPTDVEAWVAAGKLCMDGGSADQASTRFQKALDADKENQKGFAADAHYYLGYSHLMKDDLESAHKEFAETTKLDPEGKRGYADNIRFVELKIALQQVENSGNLGNALPDIDRFLTDFPTSESLPDAKFYKGMVLWQVGKRQEGFDILTELAAAHPESQAAQAAKTQYLPQMEQELKNAGGVGPPKKDEHPEKDEGEHPKK